MLNLHSLIGKLVLSLRHWKKYLINHIRYFCLVVCRVILIQKISFSGFAIGERLWQAATPTSSHDDKPSSVHAHQATTAARSTRSQPYKLFETGSIVTSGISAAFQTSKDWNEPKCSTKTGWNWISWRCYHWGRSGCSRFWSWRLSRRRWSWRRRGRPSLHVGSTTFAKASSCWV